MVWDLKVKGKVSPAALNYPKTKILKMLKDNYVPKVVVTKKSKNPKAKEFPEDWYIQDMISLSHWISNSYIGIKPIIYYNMMNIATFFKKNVILHIKLLMKQERLAKTLRIV